MEASADVSARLLEGFDANAILLDASGRDLMRNERASDVQLDSLVLEDELGREISWSDLTARCLSDSGMQLAALSDTGAGASRRRASCVPWTIPDTGRRCVLMLLDDASAHPPQASPQQTLLHELVESVPQIVTVRDSQGRYVFVNRAFEQDVGLTRSEVLGRACDELFPAGHPVHEAEVSAARLVDGAARECEQSIRADDMTRVYSCIAVALRDSGAGVVGTLRNEITMAARTDRILEAVASTSQLEGDDGLLRRCVRDISEVYRNQTSFVTVFADEARTALRTLSVWSGGDWSDNFTYDIEGTPCKDVIEGRVVMIEDRVADAYPNDEDLVTYGIQSYCAARMEASDGEVLGLVSTVDTKPIPPDAADRRLLRIYAKRIALELERAKAQRELARHRDQLEKLVDERTEALRQAQDSLLRTERLATVSRLMGPVAHELRTPLATIEVNLRLAERYIDTTREPLKRCWERVGRSISRCVQFIDELLSYAYVDRASRVATDIEPWFRSVVARIIVPAGVTFHAQCSAIGAHSIDSSRLARAVEHAVNNAIEAVTQGSGQGVGGNVSLQLSETDDGLEIEVADDGPGVPESVRTSAFEPLVSTKAMHHGLGLTLIKETLEQHGGGVRLSTESEHGTRLVMWLPTS